MIAARPFLRTLALSLLAVAFGFSRLIRPIYWEDVWWHLGVGQYILAHHHIPMTDIFSWTVRGAVWTNTEWLYEVVLYGLVHVMGLSGVIFLKIALVFAAMYFLDLRLRLWKAAAFERLLFLGMAFLGGWPFWVERADLSSLALLSALCFELDGLDVYGEGWPRRALLWIFLFFLWPNIHGAFPAGLAVIGLRGISLLPGNPALGRRVLAWAFLCAVATLLTPYGIGLPLGIVRNLSAHIDQLQEWLPPRGLRYLFFFMSLGLTAASFAFPKRRTWEDAYAAGVAALIAGYTLRHARFVHFFMVCSFPYAARQWLTSLRRARLPESWARWEKAALGVSCLVFLMICARGAPDLKGGVDTAASGYVKEACDFIEAQKIQGPFYNDYKFGSYWIWRFKGDPPVFQDGRHASVAGYDRLTEASLEAQRSPKTWNAYMGRLGIQAALVKYPVLRDGVRPAVFDQFFPRASWGLVYWDDLCLLFVRRTPRNAALLGQWEYRVIKPDWTFDSFLDQLKDGLLDRRALRVEINRALALNPNCWRARVDLHWLDKLRIQ